MRYHLEGGSEIKGRHFPLYLGLGQIKKED